MTRTWIVLVLTLSLVGGCALADRRPPEQRRPDPNMTYGQEGEPGTGRNPGNDTCTEALAGRMQPKVYGMMVGNVALLATAQDDHVALVRANCPQAVEVRAAADRETARHIEGYAVQVTRGYPLGPWLGEISTLAGRTRIVDMAPGAPGATTPASPGAPGATAPTPP